MIAETDHAEPAPWRVRARLGGELIFDTTRVRYVREWAYYPHYYIPVGDVEERFLAGEHHQQRLRRSRNLPMSNWRQDSSPKTKKPASEPGPRHIAGSPCGRRLL
ncbi:MAG TPA: DUF427 domain-containing protein [Streptosporangiaceae bacterium]|nr:DUF427 domain-containing protein [Streptosporangiaceae bacterium]